MTDIIKPVSLLFKRGASINLPTLLEGEPAFTVDSEKMYIGSSSGNIEIGAGGGASVLDELSDVTITAPNGSQVLTFSGATSTWVNRDSSGGGASVLNELGDVTITNPEDGDSLQYDSATSTWINNIDWILDSPTSALSFSGDVGIGATASEAKLFISESTTQGESKKALHIENTYAPSSIPVGNQFPNSIHLKSIYDSSNDTGGRQVSLLLDTQNADSGRIDSRGVEILYSNLGAGTVAEARGLTVASSVNSGGGAITNNYAIYLEDQTAGGTNYGVYQVGGDVINYFAGFVGVGASAPTARLDIDGNVGTARAITITTRHQATGNQQGVNIGPVIEPANNIGNPFGSVNAIVFENSAFDVTEAVACQYQVKLQAGYTGTITRGIALNIANPNKTEATASLTNNYGIVIKNLTRGITNNRGIVAEVSSGTGKHNLYISGTADNYLNGDTGIGTATPAAKLDVNGGVVVGSPTGGDKGTGTINVATNIYKANSAYTNPDFVLEKYYTGNIVKYANNNRAEGYEMLSLEETERFTKDNWRLPRIDDEPAGVFDMTDIALEKIEELYLHMFTMNKRMKGMEKEIIQLKGKLNNAN